jgi:outer membrane protein TolC
MKKVLSVALVFSLLFTIDAYIVQAATHSKGDGFEFFESADAQKAGAVSVEEAVEIAMVNNTNIQIAQKNAEIYDQQVRQYWSYVYPKLNLSGNYTRALRQSEAIVPAFGGKIKMGTKNAASATAEASLLLWQGGAVKAGIKMGDMFSDSGYYILTQTKNQIRDLVATLCSGIVLSSALIKVQEENLNIAKDHLNEINLKYKQGLASDLDILNQKVKISNSEPPLIQARNSYEIGLLTLKKVLNTDPEKELYLSWSIKDILSFPVPGLEELYAMAGENNPELVVARLNTEIAKQHIKVVRAEHFGSISAFVNGTYSGADDNVLIPVSDRNSSLGANAGIRIDIPLFEGFRVDSQIKQKQLAYDQAVLNQQETERNIKIEIQKAFLNLNEAKQRILATKGTIQQARTNLDRTKIRYRNGLASRLDLDDSALLLHDAELQFVQAVHDAFTALSNLNYAVGKEVIKK